MSKISIKDESRDKDFFTIIPNYVANHSTANDQALYLQMKKHAGEEGKCFATEKTLMKKLGIGKKAYDKSINYLFSKGWITFVGFTKGKTRSIKTYKVNNIWSINNEYYKKISAESNVSFEKDKSQKEEDKSQKQHKISAESNVEEEPVLIRTSNKSSNASSVADLNSSIELFKVINPNYEKLYSNKTERAALESLVKKFGREKVEATIKALPEIVNKKYAPIITKPTQLENKLAELIQFVNKERSKQENITITF